MYSNREISAILGLKGMHIPFERPLTILLTDSRSLTFADETLFFALVGVRDGHDYIPSLYEQGVRHFVVHSSHLSRFQSYADALFYPVDDTLLALQKLATHHRMQIACPLIAITGSNGKTVVKEWLYQLMHRQWQIVRSPRSYNSQIGVALSLWNMQPTDQLTIIEAGISKRNEMKQLKQMIKPNIGILTNIGTAHDEGFGSIGEKCLEKLTLFSDCDVIIYNADHEMTARCVRNSFLGSHEIAWSCTDKNKPLYIRSILKMSDSTQIEYQYLGINNRITLPFIDDSSIENIIHCLAVMHYFGMSAQDIAENVLSLQSVEMRLEVKTGQNNCLLINDSYSNDYNSLLIALDFLKRRSEGDPRKRVLVLSDFFQYNGTSTAFYREIAKVLKLYPIDHLVGIGPEMVEHRHYFKAFEADFHYTTESFLLSSVFRQLEDRILLLKGASAFRFERIVEGLEQKLHETILEVDLSAVAHNFRYYKSKLNPSTKMIAMVKAFGYGSGSIELTRTLQEVGCDAVAVAVADEGAEMRKAGITMPIIVMNPEVESLSLLFRYHLETEVYNHRILHALLKSAQEYGVSNFPIHLKIDTGMRRLGFTPQELTDLLQQLASQTTLRVRSVFSHLAAADDPEQDPFSLRQVELLRQAAAQTEEQLGYKVLRHILNTAGIERFPQHQMEMVRLGIGLYGYSPYTVPEIQPVASLSTTILQIRPVEPSDTIGYGRRGQLSEGGRIAILPVGYADGLSRALSNGVGCFWVNGVKAPIVGTVCMDLCMVDITHIPQVREGDKATLFSPEHPVSEISDRLGTIPYEVITGISSRVNRIYFRE